MFNFSIVNIYVFNISIQYVQQDLSILKYMYLFCMFIYRVLFYFDNYSFSVQVINQPPFQFINTRPLQFSPLLLMGLFHNHIVSLSYSCHTKYKYNTNII